MYNVMEVTDKYLITSNMNVNMLEELNCMGDDLSPLALGLRWPCSWRSLAFPRRPCNAWASDRRTVRPLRKHLHHAEHHHQIPPQVSAPDGTRSRWSTAAQSWTLYTPVTQTNTKTLSYDLLLNLRTHSITHCIHSSTHPLITVSYNLFSPVSNSHCSFIWSVLAFCFLFHSAGRRNIWTKVCADDTSQQ